MEYIYYIYCEKKQYIDRIYVVRKNKSFWREHNNDLNMWREAMTRGTTAHTIEHHIP